MKGLAENINEYIEQHPDKDLNNAYFVQGSTLAHITATKSKAKRDKGRYDLHVQYGAVVHTFQEEQEENNS